MKFLILTDGDRSVGIPGDEAVLEYDITTFDGRDQKAVVEQIRDGLKALFSNIMDGDVRVSIPCPKCNGDGSVKYQYADEVLERPCQVCDGFGERKFD